MLIMATHAKSKVLILESRKKYGRNILVGISYLPIKDNDNTIVKSILLITDS